MRTSTAIVMFCTLTIHSVANACDEWAAMVVSVNGYVVVKNNHAPAANRETVQPDSVICPGQQLEIGADSRAAIYLSNNSFVRLDQNTVLSFPATQEADDFWVELKQGVTHFMSRITQRFGVRTPYANAVVDGTEFLVAATEQNSEVSVVEGQVTVSRAQTGQQKVLTAGQMATVSAAPEINVIEISTTDTVDWAVYFPPVIFIDRLTQSNQSEQLTNAADYLKQNRPDLAIRELESVTGQGELVKTALASSYLAVGDVTAARNSIQGVGSADAQALQSLIKTITNQPAAALQFATAAVQLNPDSLPAQLALSYAHQANLNLKAALESAREASIDHPDASAAWIRLSEMQVAKGDIRSASKSVHKARQLDPDNAATLIQSGYIDLFNHKYADAETSFRQAVAKSSENPQARLGLGLVLLRQGDLEAGRKQMEFAVSLDPARSVLRSYLGRAYFEEKRDEEAATQWELAKQLDPQDPTAYFYEGVRKLYANDPIGAIDELETSRRLNDERSLYRSETLLQSDAASRSAALARAYDEVGYDQGVLLEGWNALREDPTNSEGHRLLADKYRGNSRYDAARASELLQSQLWQPLSAYPLQPQLTETGIGFVEGAGPQQPGYNEYHSLFMQDGVYGAVNGFGGSDGTWADDLVGSFLAGPVAVSLGQYHFESDGWRENSGQEQDIFSAYAQWQITPSTSIQIEKRKLSWAHGNIYFNEVDTGLVEFDRDYERETERFGLKHRISQDSYFIMSIMDQSVEEITESIDLFGIESATGQIVAPQSVEVQTVRLFDGGHIVIGAGYLEEDESVSINSSIFGFELLQSDLSVNYEELEMYVYASKSFGQYFGFELGVSYVNSDETSDSTIVTFGSSENPNGNVNVEKILPKVGGYVNLNDNWVLRGAYFETLQRNESSMQTIEPVSFMGFGQILALPDDSYTRNNELSLDGVFDQKMFVGLGVFDRRIVHQFTDTSSQTLDRIDLDAKERGGVTYWVQTLSDRWVLDAGYEYSLVDDEVPGGGSGILSGLETQMMPVSVRYIWSEYIQLVIGVTYYLQETEVVIDDGFSPKYVEEEHREEVVTDVQLKVDFGCGCGYAKFGLSNIEGVDTEFAAWNSESFLFYPGRLIYGSVSLSL